MAKATTVISAIIHVSGLASIATIMVLSPAITRGMAFLARKIKARLNNWIVFEMISILDGRLNPNFLAKRLIMKIAIPNLVRAAIVAKIEPNNK